MVHTARHGTGGWWVEKKIIIEGVDVLMWQKFLIF
jgi:hypothetical protein